MGVLKHLLLPPLALYVLVALGLVLARRWPRAGRGLALAAGLLLVLLSVPFVSAGLLISHQAHPALPPRGALPAADAIVMLGADYMPMAPELGRSAPGPISRERLVYAAVLARRTSLPLLVTGGRLMAGRPSLAEVLKLSLEEDHRVAVRWVEDRARNTRENAELTAELLRAQGLRRVLLVTHAWHMPRAKAAFEAAGLEVVPAPTGFRLWPPLALGSFVPSARSIQESYWALHEWVGRAWYALHE